ncbi:transcriptional regulator protein [Arthrobacter sp. Hiyo4]|nr:transcriptional regulator protein [Arthrobacter sp. Hiyo4]
MISQVLDDEADAAKALTGDLEWLKHGEIMAEDMFNGFDHTQYKDEVGQRGGPGHREAARLMAALKIYAPESL